MSTDELRRNEMKANDTELLRQYALQGSEQAFGELVSRHVNLVYSVALRQVRDPNLAEEITQAAFIILARKAKSLGDKTILSGWLCRTARNVAANALTIQRRRQRREQEACMETILNGGGDASSQPITEETWRQIAPLLDTALARLAAKDHDAIVLRFFEKKNFAEVGTALGASEDAAKKRVSRALEKLRGFFLKRGVNSTAAVIGETISANSIQAAPVALAKTVTAVALAKGAVASTSTLTLIKGALKIMAWTKAKTAVAVGVAAIALTLGAGYFSFFYQAHPKQSGKLKLPVGNVTPIVAYGYSRDFILLASDGSLWSWGEERLGWPVLGLGKVHNTASLRQIGNERDWVSIAVGDSQNLAIKSDGTLWGWGENLYYQLGDGTKTTRPTPVPSLPGHDWKQAAIGGNCSLALKNDGTLWAWGNNWAGQLGIGSTTATTNVVQVGTSTNWIKILGGGIQTVGLQSDGSLWFWGTLTGDAKDTNTFRVPTRISPDTKWVDACFGYSMVLAIKSDGTLWAWGNRANFYTGVADTNLNAVPMQVGTDSDWQAISSANGCFYHILKKKDGSFWALDGSELRIIKPASEYKPIKFRKLDLPKDVAAFAAGGDNIGVVLTHSGEVWTWGNVIGEHSPKAFWGPNGRQASPIYKVMEKPWQLSIVDSADSTAK
jgi:RNA polymerase sigma factor (sigma-70 family)